jgi:hypothetical protein
MISYNLPGVYWSSSEIPLKQASEDFLQTGVKYPEN